MTYPSRIFDVLTEVAACLCAQIQIDGLPEPCFCGVVPGEAIAIDYAGDCAPLCGMAWVRLSNVYSAASVGVASVLPGNCGRSTGIDIEVGIVRCISAGDSDGSPPSPEELQDATELQLADAMVLQRTLICCDALDSGSIIMGTYTPVGPQGGVVGGTVLVSVML
jgi:hypothetical protein